MGKAAPPLSTPLPSTTTTMDNKPKKKKGRPPKNATPSRRSTRRNPTDFDSDDDDDERQQKKVKLVVKLPESENRHSKSKRPKLESRMSDSGSDSGSEPDPDSEDRGGKAKKRKVNGGSDDAGSAQEIEEEEEEDEEMVMVKTESPAPGSQLESGPTTPLPDKTLLVFILDRLQKKDTYGVFSEAVDPDELPDYFEIIEQPMDFGTVRKKLEKNAYKSVEELEADIFLICANAMQYNAPDTVYYRQARSIQELAKRDFQNLKNEGEDGEPQPKVVRRGRPPGIKTQKKSLETSSPIDSAVPELSSGATLASEEEKGGGSNSYNLRKAPMQSRFRSTDPFASSYASRNGENHYDWSANWHNEFPAHILRADLKYGNKHFTVDESRRHSYKQLSHSSSSTGNYPASSNFIGVKRLVMVGLQEPLAYARSLARYAATLGPVAWKIAANKIQAGVPPGMQFGPGWVGDNGPPSRLPSLSNEKQKSSINTPPHSNSTQLLTPSTSDPSPVPNGTPQGMVEAVQKLNSQNDQKPVFQPHVNSSGGIQSPREQKPVLQPHTNSSGGIIGKPSVIQPQKYSLSDPPDLNVRVLVGSPPSSSSLQQIGSPQQPDLALQL